MIEGKYWLENFKIVVTRKFQYILLFSPFIIIKSFAYDNKESIQLPYLEINRNVNLFRSRKVHVRNNI